jgi:hypothetical protein
MLLRACVVVVEEFIVNILLFSALFFFVPRFPPY